MSITYTVTTNFGAKDSLPSGDPDKTVQGSEFTTEFSAIQTAFTLAAPAASPVFTGTATFENLSASSITGDITGNAATASAWATPRTLTFTGDATGSVSLDGSSDESVEMTVPATAHTHSDYDNSAALTGAQVYSKVTVTDGITTALTARNMTLNDLGYTGDTDATNYTHPTFAGDDVSVDTGVLSGATVISDLDFNVTTDTNGHVTDANGTYGTRTMALADLGYTGATNANFYSHPAYSASDINTSGATVVDVISTNSTGHVTALSTRSLTPADIGALKDTTDTFTGTLSVTGSIVATGNVTAYSDLRLKHDFDPAEGLSAVELMNGYTYVMNDTGEVSAGVVAQELETIAPELVHDDEDGMKSVNYMGLTAYLIESIKELSEKVRELEAK